MALSQRIRIAKRYDPAVPGAQNKRKTFQESLLTRNPVAILTEVKAGEPPCREITHRREGFSRTLILQIRIILACPSSLHPIVSLPPPLAPRSVDWR